MHAVEQLELAERRFGRQFATGAHRLRRHLARVPWQLQAEGGAFSFSGTLDCDRAAVQLDEVPHNRHAETKTVVTAAHRTISLAETIEHERQELRRNADAGISHLDVDVAVLLAQRDRD